MSKSLLILAVMTVMVLTVAVGQSAAGREQEISISGVVRDCTPTMTIQVEGVSVWAFDPQANQELADLLRTMDSIDLQTDFNAGLDSLNVAYWKLDTLLATSGSLSRDSTDSAGSFRLTMAPLDSALVVAHALSEGEAFYYAYRLIPGRADTSIVIDMSHGDCGF